MPGATELRVGDWVRLIRPPDEPYIKGTGRIVELGWYGEIDNIVRVSFPLAPADYLPRVGYPAHRGNLERATPTEEEELAWCLNRLR